MKELAAADLARASHFLQSSFGQRLADGCCAGRALLMMHGCRRGWRCARRQMPLRIADSARTDLRDTLEMLPRLARWLLLPPEDANGGFASVARRYVEDGSFVDWARKVVWGSVWEPLASALAARW